MTLTATEKTNVLFYLGWPLKSLDSASTLYNRTIVSRFEDLSSDTENIVRKQLSLLAKIEKEVEDARSRLSVKKFDKIELNENEIVGLLKEKRRAINDLSMSIDIAYVSGASNLVNIIV